MAAIDFPASPTPNQTFTAPNGVVYQWNGTLWLAITTLVSANYATIAPGGDIALSGSTLITVITLPSVGAAGQVWFVELTNSFYGGTNAFIVSGIAINGTYTWGTTIYMASGANTTVPTHWVGALSGPTVFTAASHPNGAGGVHWNGDGSRLTAFRLS